MQPRPDAIINSLAEHSGKSIDLQIIFCRAANNSVVHGSNQLNFIVDTDLPVDAMIDQIKTIMTRLQNHKITVPKLSVSFKDHITLIDRSTYFYQLLMHLNLTGMKSLSVDQTVKDYALMTLLMDDKFKKLSHLEFKSGKSYTENYERLPNNTILENNLVNYLAANQQLKTLTIVDHTVTITPTENPKLKQALCEHPKLVRFDQALGSAGNNKALDQDAELTAAIAKRKANNPKAIKKAIKEAIESNYRTIVCSAKSIPSMLNLLIVQTKQIRPHVNTWKTAADYLQKFQSDLLAFMRSKEFKSHENYSSEKNTVLEAITEYTTLLRNALEIKLAIDKNKKLAQYAPEFELFWEVNRRKIDKLVQDATPAKIKERCQQETRLLVALNDKLSQHENVKTAHMATAHENPLTDLENSITAFRDYGLQLQRDGASKKKYNAVITLADNIKQEVVNYINATNESERSAVSEKFKSLLETGKKQMRGDRSATDYIAHILLCATVVGLIGLTIRWMVTDKFFLNTTTREKKLKEVSKSLKRKHMR